MATSIYHKTNFFVVTGGPGSGKTSLLQELHSEGISTIMESGRHVIQEQVKKNGDALPWKNKSAFAQQMLEIDIKNFRQNILVNTPLIFDRGIPDVLGYVKLCKMRTFSDLEESVKRFRYNPVVFILPPWQAIYQQDTERKQDFSLAVDTHRMMQHTYTLCGYQLINVPKLSVKSRADMLLQKIKELQNA
ncbi:AAA family ATPase [Olivibacter sp. CPCC 100613]|uniref:AAA family ATPase n=1 Tax=Olivibacter sp. CPCC 100613 TaxID=3079931 RepID=UPI002FF6280B